eukprot:CAMPEP_0118956860 /NCGR_PEP_ID=MMETSP1169-20130426/61800_1 /TAXON_ID=36882 /ORGANISM="Pyramimonas obovata, Strain CCMP722" /LENGTH=258 /DNA_ID=CAMNT_0006904909 /DNA_START=303 /DNA_END=1079 /DNA_ORIENTATION=+
MGGGTVVPLEEPRKSSDSADPEHGRRRGSTDGPRESMTATRGSMERSNRRSSDLISEDQSWHGPGMNLNPTLKEDIGLITLVERLTEQQVAEFKECFDMFDEDGSGNIDSAELQEILAALGVKMNAQEIAELVGEVDSDGSGDVDFPEFCALMARQMYATGEEHQLRQVFDVLDEHGTGLIPKYALRYVILNLSTQVADDVDSMLDVVPGDFMTFPQLFKVFQDNKPNISENPKVMSRILFSKNLRSATTVIGGQDNN